MKLIELFNTAEPTKPTKLEEAEMLASLPRVGELPSVKDLQEGLDDSWDEFIEV